MTKPNQDFRGDEMPPGFRRWRCEECTAVCTYEAMVYCNKRFSELAECGWEKHQPQANGGAFGFMVPDAEATS